MANSVRLLPLLSLAFCSLAHAASPPLLEVLDEHADNVYTLQFSRDSRHLLSAAGDDQAIVWDVTSRSSLRSLQHDAPVYAAAFVERLNQVVTTSGDGTVSWFDPVQGNQLARVRDHQHAVYALAVSSEDRFMVTGGGDTDGGDTVARVWDLDTRGIVRRLAGHTRPIYGIAITSDRQTIVTASGDKTLRVWQQDSTDSTVLEAHTSDAYRCDLSSNTGDLASVSQDGTLRIWPLRDLPTHRTLQTSKTPVYAVRFTRDGEHAVSVGDDRNVRLWSLATSQLISEYRVSQDALYAIAISFDQRFMAVAGADGQIYLYDVSQWLPRD